MKARRALPPRFAAGRRRLGRRPAMRVGLTLAALAGLWHLGGWLASLPVSALSVHGERQHLDRQRIVETLSPHLRAGFWRLDTDAARRALESLPWVRRATLRRLWSRQAVAVEVIERRPLARWRDGGVLDSDGELFYPRGDLALTLRFGGPLGRRAEVLARYWALQSMFAGDPAFRITALELDILHGWRVAFPGMEVMLGHEDPMASARRLVSLLRLGLLDRQPRPERIDLRYRNGLAVR